MSRKMKAIVFEAINQVNVREVELGDCGEMDIEVETIYTFVSPGTELRVLGGHYSKPEHFPLVPGYSVVGKVAAVGAKVKGYRVGDLISGRNPNALPNIKAMWGGQCARHIYSTTGEDRPVILPEGADPFDYVIAEVSAISLRGVEAAGPVPGETAIVIGQGLIGSFSAEFLMDAGCRVIVCDIDDNRLQRALDRGAAYAVNLKDEDAVERLKMLTNGGADIVVESSGTSAGALTAYKLIRKKPQAYSKEYKVEPMKFYHGDWARLVMQANYIEDISINPFGFVLGEGVTILAPKDRGVEDRQSSVEALRTGRIASADFVDAVMPYTDAEKAYKGLLSREFLSVTFKWQDVK